MTHFLHKRPRQWHHPDGRAGLMASSYRTVRTCWETGSLPAAHRRLRFQVYSPGPGLSAWVQEKKKTQVTCFIPWSRKSLLIACKIFLSRSNISSIWKVIFFIFYGLAPQAHLDVKWCSENEVKVLTCCSTFVLSSVIKGPLLVFLIFWGPWIFKIFFH